MLCASTRPADRRPRVVRHHPGEARPAGPGDWSAPPRLHQRGPRRGVTVSPASTSSSHHRLTCVLSLLFSHKTGSSICYSALSIDVEESTFPDTGYLAYRISSTGYLASSPCHTHRVTGLSEYYISETLTWLPCPSSGSPR